MKRTLLISLFALSGLLLNSCKNNSDVVRELYYIDLLSPENRLFHQYPNEFSTYLLEGILDEDLQAYYIDYDSSGLIIPIQLPIFISKILEPYEDYESGESTITEAFDMEDVSGFLSSVTLLGFDELVADNEGFVQYINFYHPGEVTLEGLNRYICSLEFESAIEYLEEKYSPLLWNNYKLEEWGWYNQKLFIAQTSTSSKLAFDMIMLNDTSFLASKLNPSMKPEQVQQLAQEHPYSLLSRLDLQEDGKLTIAYKEDSVFYEIGQFSFEDVLKTSTQKELTESVAITPVTAAILSNGLKKQKKLRTVSSNGEFLEPLNGPDELANRKLRKISIKDAAFDDADKFYFRTIERLLGEKNEIIEELPSILYEGVKQGNIMVYNSDTLKTRMLPGEFFDNMLLDEQDDQVLQSSELEVYQVVTQTIFDINGTIDNHSIVGVGIFLPGKVVPEGINRPIGYFRIEDIRAVLSQKGLQSIADTDLKGYPLKSWNLELYQPN